MKIAFYAPMKSPHSPRPSGDRRIAGLFMAALEAAGFEVELASEFRAWEGRGDLAMQEKIRLEGEKIADELITRYQGLPAAERPRAWFTYHLYHKAPDWIGPLVSRTLGIPYFLAEASVAGKQAGGGWDLGYRAALSAVKQCARVFTLNSADSGGLVEVLGGEDKVISMMPFLDVPAADVGQKHNVRQAVAGRFRVDPDRYWLLCVAMMRQDVKQESYAQLARAVGLLQRKDWNLLVVGDGTAELTVRDYFQFDFSQRVHFLGKQDGAMVRQLMCAADLFVWPGINEAIGMVALEALSCGLPGVFGDSGGVSQIVDDRMTGLLIDQPQEDGAAVRFCGAVEGLLEQPSTLAEMSGRCLDKYRYEHQLTQAAIILQREIMAIVD